MQNYNLYHLFVKQGRHASNNACIMCSKGGLGCGIVVGIDSDGSGRNGGGGDRCGDDSGWRVR